jgi:hypothetical protein
MSVSSRAFVAAIALYSGCKSGCSSATLDAGADSGIEDAGIDGGAVALLPSRYRLVPFEREDALHLGVIRHPDSLLLWQLPWRGTPVTEDVLSSVASISVNDVFSGDGWPLDENGPTWMVARIPESRSGQLLELWRSDGGSVDVTSCTSTASEILLVEGDDRVLLTASGQCSPNCPGISVFAKAPGKTIELAGCLPQSASIRLTPGAADVLVEQSVRTQSTDAGGVVVVEMLRLWHIGPDAVLRTEAELEAVNGHPYALGKNEILSLPRPVSPTRPPPRSPVFDFRRDAGWQPQRLSEIEDKFCAYGSLHAYGNEQIVLTGASCDGGTMVARIKDAVVSIRPGRLPGVPFAPQWVLPFSDRVCFFWSHRSPDQMVQLNHSCIDWW